MEINLFFGKKKIKVTYLAVAAIILAVIACVCVIVLIPGRGLATVQQARRLLTGERYIIHAGGLVADEAGEEHSYTNTVEALNNCYDNGNRVSEFDFMMTADDEVVCAHGDDEDVLWAHGVKDAGQSGNPPTLEAFRAATFEGGLTTMSLDDLASFMNAHEDFYVVTDVKDNNVLVCRTIAEKYPKLRQNFIVQIYHPDEYDKIRELGFAYIIYTLYRATDDELLPDSLTAAAKHGMLVGFCFWDDFPSQYPESFEALKETHLPLFVHTVNDRAAMRELIEEGIDGIYTDVVNKEDQYTEGD
jgi:glycerophosphoryl diester phosphodiesterase